MSRVRKIESVAKLPECARPPRILRVAAYVSHVIEFEVVGIKSMCLL